MKLRLLPTAALAALTFVASQLSAATDNPWTARIRGTYLNMANRSDAFSALGINFAADSVHVNSKWIPEFDFAYAFTEHFSTELVLTIPQTQDVTLVGVGKLGSFKHLPPVLTAQYRFSPFSGVEPYVGAGINYTLIYDTDLKVAGVPLALENDSLGLAAQAGCNLKLNRSWTLNFDAKYVTLQSDVSVKNGPRLTTAKLNPWLLSFGAGWHF
jgi:outer membrane protein